MNDLRYLNQFTESISAITREGTVVFWGDGAHRFWGYDAQETLGKSIGETFTEDGEQVFQEMLKRLPATEGASFVCVRRKKNGQMLDVVIHLIPLMRESEGIQYVCIDRIATASDKAAPHLSLNQERLARAALAGARSAVFSVISHELNQSYFTIQNFAHAAERTLNKGSLPEVQLKSTIDGFLKEIRQQCELGSQVVEQMRQFVQGELQNEPVKMGDVIRRAIRMLQFHSHDRRILIPVKLEPAEIMVRGDSLHLEQLVHQLLKNAIEACADAHVESPSIEICCAYEESNVVLKVEDNGPGFPQESETQLFEPFFSTKSYGLGMGLTLSKRIATAHHGSIRYTRCKHRGVTTFSLHIPMANLPPSQNAITPDL